MNAHERALELAAVRFDFHLSEAEREVLDRHLILCGECRRQLADMAEDARRLAARPTRRMPPAAAAAVRARLERPRPTMSRAMVVVAAVLVILVVLATLAVGAEIQRRLDDWRLAVEPAQSAAPASPATAPSPPATPTPVATRTPTGTSAPVASAAPPFSATAWRRLDRATDQVPQAMGVASTGHGWVAVGIASESGDSGEMPSAWLSPDGVAWTRAASVALPPGATEGAMVAVTSGPQGLIATGDTGRDTGTWTVRGAVWQSTDGDTWALVGTGNMFDLGQCYGACPTLGSVAAGPAGIVVAGRRWLSEGESEYRLWHSPDGSAWERVRVPAPPGSSPVKIEVGVVTATGDGFIVAGTVNGRRAVVWASSDGRTWSEPVSLPDGKAAWPLDAASGPDTAVVVGWRCEEDAACVGLAWSRAADGTWRRARLRDFMPLGEGVIASSGPTFVILGRADRQSTAWTSLDGLTWEGHLLPSLGSGPQLLDVAGAPGSVLAAGSYDDADGQELDAIWISP